MSTTNCAEITPNLHSDPETIESANDALVRAMRVLNRAGFRCGVESFRETGGYLALRLADDNADGTPTNLLLAVVEDNT